MKVFKLSFSKFKVTSEMSWWEERNGLPAKFQGSQRLSWLALSWQDALLEKGRRSLALGSLQTWGMGRTPDSAKCWPPGDRRRVQELSEQVWVGGGRGTATMNMPTQHPPGISLSNLQPKRESLWNNHWSLGRLIYEIITVHWKRSWGLCCK